MSEAYGSNQGSEKQSRRRVFTRTESSAFRHPNREYHLANNLYSKQNTYMTAGSNASENDNKSRSKARSVSSKSLFSGVKVKNYSEARLKLQKKDNFVVPTSSLSSKTIEDYEVNPALQKVLHEKMNRKDKLKIKQQVEYSMLRKIVDQTSKTVKNRIQEAFSLKLEQRKENLSKVTDIHKFNSLISEYVQTEEDSDTKKAIQKPRRMLKTQVYSLEVSLPQKDPKPDKSKIEEPKNRINTQVKEVMEVHEVKKDLKKKEAIAVVETFQNHSQKSKKQILKKEPAIIEQKKPSKSSKEQVKHQPKAAQPLKQKKVQFNDYQDLDQIEDIVLSPQSKVQKKEPQHSKGSANPSGPNLTKTKQQKEKELKEEKERQKLKTTNELSECNKIIDLITPIGEVAGYCAQLLKKSKLNWQVPAILLYKECCQRFKKYEQVYIKAAQHGIIEEAERDKFIQDNKTIEKNLQKIVSMGKKKNKFPQEYEKLVNSSEPVVLDKTIQKEVLNFAKSVVESDEKENFDVMMCLLRMINGVVILGKLRGLNIDFDCNFELIDEDSVQKMAFKGLKLIELRQLKL